MPIASFFASPGTKSSSLSAPAAAGRPGTRVRAQRITRRLVCAAGLCLGSAAVVAADFISFSPPPFLAGPTVARAALGATYLYRGHARYTTSELRITIARQPPELARDPRPAEQLCLDVFRAELTRQYPDLFALPSAIPLQVGPLQFSQLRWSRRQDSQIITGALACGLHADHFVAIIYGTPSELALTLFPAIRRQLSALELNF